MSSRESILARLRAAQAPFKEVAPIAPDQRRNMVPLADQSPEALKARFILEADKLHCEVHTAADENAALSALLTLIGEDRSIMRWDDAFIPIPGLDQILVERGIQRTGSDDPTVNVGITGVDAAMTATGSLLLRDGAGRDRRVSLLPARHIAILRSEQILPDLEAWFVQERQSDLENFRAAANVVIVSGPSKTADIAQELILGAHGPVQVQIIVID